MTGRFRAWLQSRRRQQRSRRHGRTTNSRETATQPTSNRRATRTVLEGMLYPRSLRSGDDPTDIYRRRR